MTLALYIHVLQSACYQVIAMTVVYHSCVYPSLRESVSIEDHRCVNLCFHQLHWIYFLSTCCGIDLLFLFPMYCWVNEDMFYLLFKRCARFHTGRAVITLIKHATFSPPANMKAYKALVNIMSLCLHLSACSPLYPEFASNCYWASACKKAGAFRQVRAQRQEIYKSRIKIIMAPFLKQKSDVKIN